MKYYCEGKEISKEEFKKIKAQNEKYIKSEKFEDFIKCKFLEVEK